MTKYLVALLLSAGSIGSLWAASEVLDTAQRQLGSTFQLPTGRLLLSSVLYILAGALFSGVLMIRAKRDHRYGYLAAAGLLPALIVAYQFMFYAGWSLPRRQVFWIFSEDVGAVSAFAVGAVIAHLVWRATGPSRFEVADG